MNVIFRTLLLTFLSFAAAILTIAISYSIQSRLERSFPYTTKQISPNSIASEELIEWIVQEPLHPVALRELALRKNAQLAMLNLSHKVSRRDPLTQLLLIEQASNQGDIATAIEHYSVLLAISPDMHEGIVKLLGKAALEPKIYGALLAHQAQPWFPHVMKRMVAEASTGEVVSYLLANRPLAREVLTNSENIRPVIGLLLAKPDPQYAFEFINERRADDSSFAHFGFSPTTLDEQFVPLNWKLAQSVTTTSTEKDDEVDLQFTAPPNARSSIAERFTNFGAGVYRLKGIVKINNAPRLQIHWNVKCIGQGSNKELIQLLFQPSATFGNIDAYFTLPERCPVQRWQLEVLGDDARLPSVVTLSGMQLLPVN
jgi:hypothetical protein